MLETEEGQSLTGVRTIHSICLGQLYLWNDGYADVRPMVINHGG